MHAQGANHYAIGLVTAVLTGRPSASPAPLTYAVRRSSGRPLDRSGAAGLGARVDELTAGNQCRQSALEQARARDGEPAGRLREARHDLVGALTSIRG
ncbi:hypothetical protein ACIQMV_21300 [Streptomyces sp. NPDC091412]|uniref:hypothetical protein n=1 Tax=Streptomyces sp. NPDC091412 TaxID=3366002 RepID=UPI0037FAF278